MRMMIRFAVVAMAAVGVMTVAWACEGQKTAGCAHGDAAKAEAGGCPHAKAEAMQAGAKEEGGCPHAKAEAMQAGMKGDAGCGHSQMTDAQRAALEKGSNATLVGRVLCSSCDLKIGKSCQLMLKTEDGQLFTLVSSDALKKLSGETQHGDKKVEITGTVARDGESQLVRTQTYKILG